MNARGGISAIALSFPAVIIGFRGDAFLSCCYSARNISSLASGIYVEVLPLYAHDTADVLSQKLPICLNFRSSTTYSITSHPRTNPDFCETLVRFESPVAIHISIPRVV